MAHQFLRATQSARDNLWATGGGIYYGYNDKQEVKTYTGDRHIVTIAPNGSGKTRRLLLVTAARLAGKWSMVIPDIKGELTMMLAQHFRDCGSEVIILDPFGSSGQGFNPVMSMAVDDDMPDNVLGHAEAIIKVAAEQREPHFPQGAQDIWAGIEMPVRLVMENGSMGDVRALLSKGTEDFQEMILADEFVHEGRTYPGILKAANVFGWPEIAAKVNRYSDIKPDNRELLGILSTALVQTRWLDSRPLRRDLQGSQIDFGILKEKPTVVFLILPPKRLGTHATWLRLVITSIVQALMNDVKRAKVPCLLALDEYYALAEGGFDIITKNMAMFRGYGIKLWTIWQDLSQAQKLLGRDGFETFLANAGIVQAFAPQCLTTSEYLSRRTGVTTRQALALNQSSSRTPGSMPNRSDSASLSQMSMPLMLPQDLRLMPSDQTLVLSHALTDGQGIYRVPYPTDIPGFGAIMARDPAN